MLQRTRLTPSPGRAAAVALLALAALTAGLAACASRGEGEPGPAAGPGGGAGEVVERTGQLEDGAHWRLRAPAAWNGTLLLYSRGLAMPGAPNEAFDAPDETTAQLLLDAGYALVGSSYEEPGWTLDSAVGDQHALLEVVAEALGPPERTIAWGHSLGGLVTVGLAEQHPDDIDGAVAACGIVGGPELLWDPLLDLAFAVRTLLVGPDAAVELTGFDGPADDAFQQLSQHAAAALASPEGRARLALAAAVADVPPWAPDAGRRPASVRGQLEAQAANIPVLLLMTTVFRADMEEHVGGNPSSNVGVDYAALLDASATKDAVRTLYAGAEMDLADDLRVLAATPRTEADPDARAELRAPVEPSGALEMPVVLLHGTADAVVTGAHVRAYAARVAQAGRGDLLRVAAVDRAGHCSFTTAEQVAVLGAVARRIAEGRWPETDASALNAAASGLGGAANVGTAADGTSAARPPAFVEPAFTPGLRTQAASG